MINWYLPCGTPVKAAGVVLLPIHSSTVCPFQLTLYHDAVQLCQAGGRPETPRYRTWSGDRIGKRSVRICLKCQMSIEHDPHHAKGTRTTFEMILEREREICLKTVVPRVDLYRTCHRKRVNKELPCRLRYVRGVRHDGRTQILASSDH